MVAISLCTISGFVGLAITVGFGVGIAVTASGVGLTDIRSLESEGIVSALLLHARSVHTTNKVTTSRRISLTTILRNYSEVS